MDQTFPFQAIPHNINFNDPYRSFTRTTDEIIYDIKSYITKAMQIFGAPGLAISIVQNNATFLQEGKRLLPELLLEILLQTCRSQLTIGFYTFAIESPIESLTTPYTSYSR
jgi:hypothetical protein